MQRTQKTLGSGLVFGLLLSLAAAAQAQTYYVPASTYRTVPVAQSVVVTQSFGTPFYSNYSRAQAWNNRTSAPAVYAEMKYLPESIAIDPISISGVMSSRSYVASPMATVASQPAVSSRSVSSSEPVVYSEPVYVSRSVVSSGYAVTAPPVTYPETVAVSQPVRAFRSVVVSRQVASEGAECKSTRIESIPKVTTSISEGRRVTTYRYEYELDHRPARVTIEFDAKD